MFPSLCQNGEAHTDSKEEAEARAQFGTDVVMFLMGLTLLLAIGIAVILLATNDVVAVYIMTGAVFATAGAAVVVACCCVREKGEE